MRIYIYTPNAHILHHTVHAVDQAKKAVMYVVKQAVAKTIVLMCLAVVNVCYQESIRRKSDPDMAITIKIERSRHWHTKSSPSCIDQGLAGKAQQGSPKARKCIVFMDTNTQQMQSSEYDMCADVNAATHIK